MERRTSHMTAGTRTGGPRDDRERTAQTAAAATRTRTALDLPIGHPIGDTLRAAPASLIPLDDAEEDLTDEVEDEADDEAEEAEEAEVEETVEDDESVDD